MKTGSQTLPRLFAISNSRDMARPEKQVPELVGKITAHLPACFQLREKSFSAKALYDLALSVAACFQDNRSLFFVNERFDIALATQSHGVHLPENSSPLKNVRKSAPNLIIGKSTHSIEAALAAQAEGADYLFFGPVFETPLKKRYGPPMGLDKLESFCRNVSLPVFAIGGITPGNTRQCLEHGAYGVAAMSIFTATPDLEATLNNFLAALDLC